MEFAHKSVLLDETIEGLKIKPDGIYLDGTLGGGGHSSEICRRLSGGRLIGIDQDAEAIAAASERLEPFREKVTLVRDNYCNAPAVVKSLGLEGVDGIVLDLGEDQFAKNIAKHIAAARKDRPIETTGELNELIKAAIPAKMRANGGHPSKRTFQAIRIECNHELDVLKNSLDELIGLLNPGGRICIITFHSLEDRIVKSAFRKNENPCTCPPDFPVCVCGKESQGKVITRKPILPGAQELENNSRSKSAKLRIFEKKE